MQDESTSTRQKQHPIPATVAAIFGAFRNAFRRPENEREVTREDDRVRHSRSWSLTFVVDADEVDGGFVAECPELPGALSQGETEEEALNNLADAVNGILATRVQRHLREAEAGLNFTTSLATRTVTISLP